MGGVNVERNHYVILTSLHASVTFSSLLLIGLKHFGWGNSLRMLLCNGLLTSFFSNHCLPLVNTLIDEVHILYFLSPVSKSF